MGDYTISSREVYSSILYWAPPASPLSLSATEGQAAICPDDAVFSELAALYAENHPFMWTSNYMVIIAIIWRLLQLSGDYRDYYDYRDYGEYHH